MKRPHEQTWTYEPEKEGFFGHHQHVDTNGAFILAPIGIAAADATAALRLIAAAPDMARALILIDGAIAAGAVNKEEATEVIETALRKAGVLP